MKITPIIISSLVAVTLLVGCKPANEPSAPSESASPALANAKQETKEAVQRGQDYAYAQKAEFVAAMQTQITAMNKEIDELSAKVESSSATAKEEAKVKLQALRDQSAALSQKLDAVGGATESTWDSVKAGFNQAYDQTKEAFKQSRQWLSEKIAP